MQLDTNEFSALADMLNAQRMEPLRDELARSEKEVVYWRTRCECLERQQAASTMENALLKNYILLSAERIKAFVKRLARVEQWALLHSFVQWSLPEELAHEEEAIVNAAMPLPSAMVTQVNIGQAADVIAEGGVKNVSVGGATEYD